MQTEPQNPESSTSTQPESPEDMPLGKWLVPFFVIPLVIVISLALIFLVFGMLTANERSPRENLDRVLHGGRNDRKQGAFELQRQLQNLSREKLALDAQFVPDLMKAYEASFKDKEDLLIRCWLVAVLGYLGDPQAVPVLKAALQDSSEAEDSGTTFSIRFLAAQSLATLGTPESLEPLAETLKSSSDKGIRIVAAAGLGRMHLPKNQEALRAVLQDPEPEVRWTAAVGLARFGDNAAIPVLREMLDPKNASVWAREDARQDSLRLAIESLVLLKDVESIVLFKELDAREKNRKIRDFAKKGIEKLETREKE